MTTTLYTPASLTDDQLAQIRAFEQQTGRILLAFEQELGVVMVACQG